MSIPSFVREGDRALQALCRRDDLDGTRLDARHAFRTPP